jgi:hypothetical protein
MSGVQRDYGYQYETVAAGQSLQMLGGSGAAGDYLHSLIVTVNTALTSGVSLTDGVTNIVVVPANVATGVGVIVLPMNMASLTSGWKVTTGAGVQVIAVGIFS